MRLRSVTLAAAMLLAAACSDLVAPRRAPEPGALAPNASLQGGDASVPSRLDASKCLTVAGAAETANYGAPLILWDCSGWQSQRFSLPAVGGTGEVRAYDMCLDDAGGAGNDGDAIVLWPCHGGYNQQWTLTAEGEIRSFNGKCLDVWYALAENGASVKLYACHGGANQRWELGSVAPPPPPPPSTTSEFVVAAGDIAKCSRSTDEATASLVERLPGTVIPLGDLAYDNGTPEEFANCYHPSWGRLLARTRPVLGNHEYSTAGAAGYFGYFGAAAADPSQGWYSYDLGAWHVVVLNSGSCGTVSCGSTSAQVAWLKADLAANPRACTLAVWHHPRFNSGVRHGNNSGMRHFWNALYAAGADVVLNGHEHLYERFAPQSPAQVADPTNGIRQFTVGTGGASLRAFADVPQPNSEVRLNSWYGVLKLELLPTSYRWEFVDVDGVVRDAGEGSCH